MRTGVKPCVRAAAFVIAATLLLLSGCAAQEGGAYLTVNGEETDDAVYIYYLKSAMYRVMAMYEAESSTGAFWEAELTGGETPFDTAKRLAAERTAEEYIINGLFSELSLSWDDAMEEKYRESYDAVTVNGRSYERFLKGSGLTDEAWRFITKTAVKRAALEKYYAGTGQSLSEELSRRTGGAAVKTNAARLDALSPAELVG